MKILNTGGTLNKRYNKKSGELEVAFDNNAIDQILQSLSYEVEIAGMIYKDSLEFTDDDRLQLASIIKADTSKVLVVVHGTDSINISAEIVSKVVDDRVIVFTGAMRPYEIDPTEASLNIGLALGFAASQPANGVYICMSGIIAPHEQIRKNRSLGKFEVV